MDLYGSVWTRVIPVWSLLRHRHSDMVYFGQPLPVVAVRTRPAVELNVADPVAHFGFAEGEVSVKE